VNARALYCANTVVKVRAKFMFCFNEGCVPHWDTGDKAFTDRMLVFPCMSKFVDPDHPFWLRKLRAPDLPENRWIFPKVLDVVERVLKPDVAGITRWLIKGHDRLRADPGAFSKLPAAMTDFKTGMLSLTGELREWLLVQMEYLGSDAQRDGDFGLPHVNLYQVYLRYVDKRRGPPGKKLKMLDLYESIRVLVDGVHKAVPDFRYTPSRTNPTEKMAGMYRVMRWKLRDEEEEGDAPNPGYNRGASGFH
jgi:hypothetical protein